ncbi:hypothetical protein AAF712_013504 [Marasmius tenuissimus]|uniref:DUF6532 domain-containing protein n=1 Tax=Marasmius tenuissimus TaxID=585030 RepID=A0ABR2ZFM7_9AGAR
MASSLASRLRQKPISAASPPEPPPNNEGRPQRGAAKDALAKKGRIWMDPKKRKTDTPAANDASTTKKNANNAGANKTSSKKKTPTTKTPTAPKRHAPDPSTKAKASGTVQSNGPSKRKERDINDDDDSQEGGSDRNGQKSDDDGDIDRDDSEADQPFGKRPAPDPLGSEEEPDVFITPVSRSRASSVSLPPESDFMSSDWREGLDDFEEEDNTIPANTKRHLPTIESSDSERETLEPPAKKSRGEKFLEERPTIPQSTKTQVQPGATSARKKAQLPKVTWPEETEYVLAEGGKRAISKSAQDEVFNALIEKSATNAIALFLWECAFPEKIQQARLLLDALVMAAQELKQPAISKRLQDQSQKKYRKPLMEYVFNRVVHVRSAVRVLAATAILGTYPLTGRVCNVADFVKFIRRGHRYIYPQEVQLITAPPSTPTSTCPAASGPTIQESDTSGVTTEPPEPSAETVCSFS